jgi:hypothetical protein
MYPPIFNTEKLVPCVDVLTTDCGPDNWDDDRGFL